jgi:hypothetical protein
MRATFFIGLAGAALALFFLAGCGTTTGGTGGGYGADAGPWPSSPARTTPTAAGNPSAAQVPNAALVVLLRGKASEEQALELDIAQIDLKYGDQWVTVTNREAIAKIESLPLRMTKGSLTAMLAGPKTTVPKRKYTHLRLRFDDRKTKLVAGEKKLPLTLQATLELGEWTPDEKTINTLTVSVDGAKVTATGNSATLPADAISVAKGTAAAGVSGKIVPALPTARVEAYWGDTKVVIGSAVPSAQDGSFQIPDLPAGAYRLAIVTPGYHRDDPPKDPLLLEDKVVLLGDIRMLKDVETK